jgi:hypothetical protein
MRDAKYSGAVNVDHNGEKEKGSFEANCSSKHMHFGLWRAAASSESVVARDLFWASFRPITATFLWSTKEGHERIVIMGTPDSAPKEEPRDMITSAPIMPTRISWAYELSPLIKRTNRWKKTAMTICTNEHVL